MAYLGRGFYKKQIPLRAIGVFPTWDRLIFAVRKDTGIESLEAIKHSGNIRCASRHAVAANSRRRFTPSKKFSRPTA
ncbi:MAG: hypothetical protein Q8S00_24775 [Deltaproteobacteria bacterium]|nr:hypothetical protein [Deltaproteobacteria bacterium]MDZ4341151.1 hypothetical protein [Candidatus Binatia bacterium]